MAVLVQTTRADLLNLIFKGTALTGKAAAGAGVYYVSLHTADPGEDGQTSNEVTGGSYAAKVTAAADWTATATVASPSVISNSVNPITFVTASASWGTVTHAGLWNHITNRAAANFLGRGALTASQAVASGNTFSFPTSSLVVQMSSV
jgi:hypothetical protein